jgi:hypothetical protein
MSATVWAVVVSAIACLIVLGAMVKGLYERLKALAASLGQMQQRVQPLADVIIAEGAVAQERLQQINEATQGLRRGFGSTTAATTVATAAVEAAGSASRDGEATPGGSSRR